MALSRELADVVVVTTQTDYFTRLENSLYEFVGGCLLALFAAALLWVVEKQAVKFSLLMGRCQTATRMADSKVISPALEGRPVCVKDASRVEPPPTANRDPATGFTVSIVDGKNAVRLRRTVEMYQWVESSSTKDKGQGQKETTYTYEKKWSSIDYPSDQFHVRAGHENPRRNPSIESEIKDSEKIFLGAYRLNSEQVSKMHAFHLCAVNPADVAQKGGRVEKSSIMHAADKQSFNSNFESKTSDLGDYVVYNGTLTSPTPGTVRVCYEAVYEGGPITVIGVQTNESFRSFNEADAHSHKKSCLANACRGGGGDIEMGAEGIVEGGESEPGCGMCGLCCMVMTKVAGLCAEGAIGNDVLILEERHTTVATLFSDEKTKFYSRLYMMRLLGCFLLFVAIYLMFSPIYTVFSFIPYLGTFITNLFWLIALLLGFVLGALIISLAWVVYHPEMLACVFWAIGIPLWLAGSTASAVLAGQIFTCLAFIPLGLFVLNWVEDCQFASEQRELDRAMATQFPKASELTGTGVVATAGEKDRLLKAR